MPKSVGGWKRQLHYKGGSSSSHAKASVARLCGVEFVQVRQPQVQCGSAPRVLAHFLQLSLSLSLAVSNIE